MRHISEIKIGEKYKHLPSGQIKTFTEETDIPWEVVNSDNYVIIENNESKNESKNSK